MSRGQVCRQPFPGLILGEIFENTVTVGEKFDNKAVGTGHFQYPINKIKSGHGGKPLII